MVEKLTIKEVQNQIQELTTEIVWLQEFKLDDIKDDRIKLRLLIMCYLNKTAFQTKKNELGKFVNGAFDIKLKDDTPVKIKPYKVSR